jgi:hypothetical protein
LNTARNGFGSGAEVEAKAEGREAGGEVMGTAASMEEVGKGEAPDDDEERERLNGLVVDDGCEGDAMKNGTEEDEGEKDAGGAFE